MTLASKIKKLREQLRLTQAQFAEAVGVDQSTISKWERGTQFPEHPQVRSLAALANTTTDEFLGNDVQDRGDGPKALGELDRAKLTLESPSSGVRLQTDKTISTVPVVGVVRAGAWMLIEELENQILGDIPVPVPPYYLGKAFALRVEGDSMNLVYRPGTLLICVSIFAYDREIVSGRRVIVYRRRANDLIEATVKELIVDDKGRGWLHPRSSDSRYKDPLPVPVNDGLTDEDFSDGDQIEIRAVVIGSYSPEEG